MATQAQIDAARRNGSKSRGPVTDAGKATSSQNALTHGLTAKFTVCLDNEEHEQFAIVLDAYHQYFRPAGQVERDLVVEIATSRWRLRRCWELESSLLNLEMADQAEDFNQRHDPPLENLRLASAWKALANSGGSLPLLNRYEARVNSSYTRALRDLQLLRSGKLNLRNEPGSSEVAAPAQSEVKIAAPNEPKPGPQPPQPVLATKGQEPTTAHRCKTNPSCSTQHPAESDPLCVTKPSILFRKPRSA
ncbi:MAG: hypothetical protein WKF37_11790 [Bryobacteraceae bacterium]